MVSWCHVLFWEFCPSALHCPAKKSDRPYERSCLPQCLSLTTFARNLRRRVRSPFSVSVSRSPKKAKRSVWVVCIVFVKFVTPCHRCIDFYRLAPKPARKKSPVMRANHLSITEPKSKVVTTWFGKLRAKVRREGIGRLLDLRPDMPRHADVLWSVSVVFVFHAYVSQVNVLGLGYTTHPVLEGNNLKTEEGQSEGQRQQPFLHESRVNHLAILWLVTFCHQTFPWNDSPRQNKDITTWPQQNLEGRAWIGGSMLSRKLMEIME